MNLLESARHLTSHVLLQRQGSQDRLSGGVDHAGMLPMADHADLLDPEGRSVVQVAPGSTKGADDVVGVDLVGGAVDGDRTDPDHPVEGQNLTFEQQRKRPFFDQVDDPQSVVDLQASEAFWLRTHCQAIWPL